MVSGCYSARLIRDGEAEIEVGRRTGPVAIDIVAAPTPDRPSATVRLSHHPVRRMRKGGDSSLILRKRREALVALGVGLQWWASFLWLRDPGDLNGAAAVSVNLLGAVTLLTRGRGGGYLGWLLPETLRYDYLSDAREVEASAGAQEPLARIVVTLEAPYGRWSETTGPAGEAIVHLVNDLGLASSPDDHPILVTARAAGSREVIAFHPGDFLHGYYAFAAGSRVQIHGENTITALAMARTYALVGHLGDRYDVRLDDGTAARVAAKVPPRLVRYGAASRREPLRTTQVHLLSPHLVTGGSSTVLRPGQSARLLFGLEYAGEENPGELHLSLRRTGTAAVLEIPSPVRLGRLRSGRRTARSVGVSCPLDAPPGRHVVQLLVDADGITVAEAELTVEVVP